MNKCRRRRLFGGQARWSARRLRTVPTSRQEKNEFNKRSGGSRPLLTAPSAVISSPEYRSCCSPQTSPVRRGFRVCSSRALACNSKRAPRDCLQALRDIKSRIVLLTEEPLGFTSEPVHRARLKFHRNGARGTELTFFCDSALGRPNGPRRRRCGAVDKN